MFTREFEWINRLLSKAGSLAKGAGDDAFVFGRYLISADMSVEGTHFRLDWNSPAEAVEKCLLSNFSDINAMGGSSCAILFSVCMNKKWSKETRDEIADAVAKICKKHKVKILGGDTTGGNIGVFSVTVFGKMESKPLLRSAAKEGDDAWVSGCPGKFTHLCKIPKPPLKLGRQLAKIKGIGACIDTSDSLAESLLHISEQSKVQIQLEKNLLKPISLNASEDYELLFTARKSARKSILKLTKKFTLQRIGTIKKGTGIYLDGKKIKVNGWQHF
jgi:thiamine-monophosphate kinase